MTADVLLLAGVAAAVTFVAVLLIEGVLRPGYDPVYHTGSELELGERGWVQRANFFVMGAGVFAFAAGLHRTRAARPHRRVLELDRGTGHPPRTDPPQM